MSKREEAEPAARPLESIDEVLAKHPGDWPACIAELRTIGESIARRLNEAKQTVQMCREALIRVEAMIAILERLPAK